MTIADPDVVHAIGLPPEQAIGFLEAKGAQVTGSWREWLNGEHARAFTVANVTKLDVLQDIQNSLGKALKDGQTVQQWKDGLIPELQKKGWWRREGTTQQLREAGRVDEGTGEIAKGLNPRRLGTIFATNMQSAYMAGRYQQMIEQVDERPFWEYVAVLDSRTRPAHRAMSGRVFRYDDAGWQSFYPPCGYRCRCRVRNLSDTDVRRGKLTVSSTEGKLREVKVPLKGGGEATSVRYVDRAMPGGGFQTDPGFANNPGRDTWQPRLEGMDVGLSRKYVETAVQGPAFERFVQQAAPKTLFPVAVLREQDQQRLGTTASVAYLSGEQLVKQKKAHPNVDVDGYRLLPDIIERGEVTQDPDGYSLIYLAKETGLWWRAALKATRARDQLFVQSLLSSDREEKLRRNLANKRKPRT